MLNFGNKEFRNLQEQVEKNAEDIYQINMSGVVLSEFGIKVVGQLASVNDLPNPALFDEEDVGNAYAVGASAPYDLYVLTRPFIEGADLQWFNIGKFPVPGPEGEQGEQGVQGETGPRGNSIFTGAGTPVVSAAYKIGDGYLDSSTGFIYTFNGTQWSFTGSVRGPQGPSGLQGVQGPEGAQGPAGPQGPQGEPGNSFTIIGQVANVEALPNPQLVPNGSAYLVGSEAPFSLYVLILEPSRSWFNTGTINETSIITLDTSATQGSLSQTDYNTLTSSPQTLIRKGDDIFRLNNEDTTNLVYNTVDRYGVDHPTEKYIIISKGTKNWSISTDRIMIESDLADYVSEAELSTALNAKQNVLASGVNIKTINNQSILGSGNLNTAPDLSNYATISQLNSGLQGKQNTLSDSATDGNIKKVLGQSLLGTGNIAVNWGDITGTLTSQGDLKSALDGKQDLISASNKIAASNITGLSTVATTGSYVDLLNKPTLFSGSYNDLTDKPTIPTSTSQLINDSNFITLDDANSIYAQKGFTYTNTWAQYSDNPVKVSFMQDYTDTNAGHLADSTFYSLYLDNFEVDADGQETGIIAEGEIAIGASYTDKTTQMLRGTISPYINYVIQDATGETTTWTGSKLKMEKDDVTITIHQTNTTYSLISAINKANSAIQLSDLNSALQPYALSSAIPTNNNQLTNGAGYITSSALNGYATQTYVDDAIAGLGSVFNIKGSVPTVAALPASGNSIGDVYFVVARSAGYVWIEINGNPQWEQLGETIDLSAYALKSEIPTTTSQLTNDSGFITLNDVNPSFQYIESLIPTAVSQLNNDSGFLSSASLKTVNGSSVVGSGNIAINWGDISGTLASQIDLQTALDGKLSTTGGTMTGNLNLDNHSITYAYLNGPFISRARGGVVAGVDDNEGLTVLPRGGLTFADNNKYFNNPNAYHKTTVYASSNLTTNTFLTLPSTGGTLALQSEVAAVSTAVAAKQDAATAYNTSNIVYSATEPANPTSGMIWLRPIQ